MISKKYFPHIVLVGILLLATFLYTYRLSQTMQFIGDSAWFYLDARDLLLGKSFPLVGITSSHPWMHQGAYWTYLLAIALFLGKFSPLAGGYLAALIGVITVAVAYFVGKKLFSEGVGLMFAFLYTLSPLAIYNMRLPLDTTPLPLLSLLFLFFIFEWVRGKRYGLFATGMTFALLYNFELASIMLVAPLGIVSLYGLLRRKTYAAFLFDKKLIGATLIGMVIIMIPMLIYDVGHGFPQTIRFGMWLVYRLLVTVGILQLYHPIAPETWSHFFTFILSNNARIMYLIPHYLALAISLLAIVGICIKTIQEKSAQYILLTLFTVTTIGVFLVYKTPSEAYIPIFLPFLLLSLAVVLLEKRIVPRIGVVFMILLGVIGAGQFVMQDFQYDTVTPYGFTYDQRVAAVNSIIQKSGKSTYTIEGKEMFIVSPAYTMGYEYLLWYKGHPVADAFPEKMFTIQETPESILIQEK